MKLPHVLQVILAFLAVVAAHVSVAGQTVTIQFSVPAAVASSLVAAVTLIGMFSDSVQTAMRQKAAMLLAKAGPGACFVMLLGALGCQGCTNGQPPPVVTPSVDLGVCIFDQYTAAPACRPGGNWILCTATIATACGADAAAVERVLTAQRKAMIADGFVVPPLPAADAGK